jgi:4-aminobutyrate aminotransferase-like enzyme
MSYPLADFEHENKAEEDRCLDGVRNHIKEQRDAGKAVAAIIIEPISGLNG